MQNYRHICANCGIPLGEEYNWELCRTCREVKSIGDKTVTNYETLTRAAEIVGVPRGTLQTAIDRGDDIETITLQGGTVLVSIPSIRAWMKLERHVGRPPKGD